MTTLSSSTPVARKAHRCWWCGEEICKGEQYARWTNADSDGVCTTKAHLECKQAWSSHLWSYDEVGFAEFSRGCTCERNYCRCREGQET